jgi:hypothetical protein
LSHSTSPSQLFDLAKRILKEYDLILGEW